MAGAFANETKTFNTIIDFLRFGISKANAQNIYFGHGTDNAYDDLFHLILETLFLPFDLGPIFLQSVLTTEEKNLLCNRLEQRIIERIPVPYITNRAYFCDLPFYVDKRVLIPRSPIAELIKQYFLPWIEKDVKNILDLCTGSGCIAIACSHAFPEAMVDAVDISADALKVAKINCEMHGVEETVHLIQSDCFTNVPPKKYDLIVSNPPYVSQDEMQILPQEYLHEPRLALEAKGKGLAIVDQILKNAVNYLNDEGILVVEVGNSEEALIAKYPQVLFTWLDFEKGGHGVFLLTAQQLKEYGHYFA
ncbi:adenine specific methylase (plasmid) [Legionella adelaidensis]|uniref:Adenine specific methylase n=1 Tax=Legionella adelaidensis TaxID=45056 RepID=A0A0W0R339_9GAMM|nr:50S ribosomal protein L3 N(5)-glutamine methyltransferase [Legionella adelaidensis]KTC65451.1 N5-glutamine S-adenosyl-L-methionine-dependent methyltransferase [Legionella adelaidensis]VEH84728.1 adenine specific methylase [Legionella adelaidensis]